MSDMIDELGIKAKLTMWGRWVGRGNIAASPVGGGSVGSSSPLGYKSAWSLILPCSDGGGVDVGCDDDMLEIEQERIDTLNDQGYRAVVCWGFDEAQSAIRDYIKGYTVKQVTA